MKLVRQQTSEVKRVVLVQADIKILKNTTGSGHIQECRSNSKA